MNLSHGRRSEGDSLKIQKQLLKWLAEFQFNQRPDHLRWICWHIALEAPEFESNFFPDDIRTCAEHLTKFDKSRPQLGQCESKPLRGTQAGNRLSVGRLQPFL